MSTTQNTPITTATPAEVRIHVDRSQHEGLEFEDTNGEPIALCGREGWDLFVLGDDNPYIPGGHPGMTDDEVQTLAREALRAGL